MGIVREHINERFIEDSDAIHDLGIGMPGLIKDAVQVIFLEDLKNNFIEGIVTPGNLSYISIEGGYGIPKRFKLEFYKGRLKDENGKQLNRTQYAKKLVASAGILKCFNEISPEYHQVYNIIFHIKPQYQKMFTIGEYDSEDYIHI